MKQFIVRTLDTLIPPDIKEFEQYEELIRARALIFILLLNLITAVVVLAATLVKDIMPAELRDISLFTLSFCIVSYSLALWVFYRSGLFSVSGNIYALACYFVTVITVLKVPNQNYVFLILTLLAMPVIVSLIANHVSAIIWLVIIAVTPELVIYSGNTKIGEYFLSSWIACCAGLFFALYMENYYRESIRARLSAECTKFEFAAAHDPLTELANRATFDRRLQESIEFCTLHNTKAVLLCIDLDRFKLINDTFGHQAGDIVLTVVANRLHHLARSTDTVARLGGDEFAILFDQCDPDHIKPIIERVANVISEPIKVFDKRLTVECSIGMVICPDDGLCPEQLSHEADERMYENKRKALQTG